MSTLRISDDLTLPIEAVTETFAILAKRGKGKTNTAVVMAEEMIDAGQPVVIVDPVGVWWGIRSGADGTSDGLPVVIFGGDHADLPLQETAGALIADVVVEHRMSVVLDLSLLSKSASRRFMADFVETLYRRNRDPLHVILDEADAFAPQRTSADGARLLGAVEDLVRRGRARGLGCTLITQRPAVINKDVLTQAEVLVALGMTGPQDIAAIDTWVSSHGDPEEARKVKASLAGLDVGEAWVWSPSWLDVLQRVRIRARRTFDSSRTPKPGERRIEAQRMAPVDLEALGQQIDATVEKAKADDPKALRKRITELEAAVTERERVAPVEQVEVYVVDDEQVTSLTLLLADARDAVARAEGVVETAREAADVIASALADARAVQGTQAPTPPSPPPTLRRPDPAPRRAGAVPEEAPAGNGATTLPKAQAAILTVLRHRVEDTVANIAVLTGYSSKGGGFRNSLGALRTAGYIEGRDPVKITDAGAEAIGPVPALPTGGALREHWKAHAALGKAHGLILDALAKSYPQTVTVDWLAAQTGYEATGGGFRNAVSRLRSLGLISGNGFNLVIDPTLVDW